MLLFGARAIRDMLRKDVMELARAIGSDRVPRELLDDLIVIYKAAGGGRRGRGACKAHMAKIREEVRRHARATAKSSRVTRKRALLDRL